MSAEGAVPLRPGRQRSRAVDEAILAATLDLLRERGYTALTMAAAIERAGVSSATLYRRWPTKQELVAAAVDSLVPDRLETDAGTLAGDLAAFLHHVLGAIAARGALSNDLTVEAGRHPELAAALREKLLRPRLGELDLILERAVERGELAARPAAEEALSLVVGAVHHRTCLVSGPVDPAFFAAALAGALGALGAAPRVADSAGPAGGRELPSTGTWAFSR